MSRFTYGWILLCGLIVFDADAQQFDRIKIASTHLRGDVYLLQSRAGGNLAAYVGKEGILLVDSEYKELGDKVEAALAGISDRNVRWIFNTHWHFDHVGGNERFARGGSSIIAHENVRERMAADRHIAVIDTEVPASPEAALPRITFTDKLTLHFDNGEIFIFHLPAAHTDGDGVVFFKKANVIHTGDIVFHGGYPFIDVSNGGTIDGMIKAIKAILERCNEKTLIIPGHGSLSNKAELKAYGDMLKAFRDIMAQEMTAGKDLETILKERPTAALDEKWGRNQFPPHLFTEIVYRSLNQEKEK
jgi:glyoxylase-like metal-dependent hydrolase (beta-lactamase superfamily II)